MFYLASQSPRRRQLLESVGLAFEVLALEVDESIDEGESPAEAVERLARTKARAGAALAESRALPALPVMAADTMVVVDGEPLGKPGSGEEARGMLERLSGRSHQVLTAVALRCGRREWARTSETRVTMKPLTRSEIERYWASGEPRDKAGSYAIQGIGGGFVSRIEGSYSSVVGLPLYEARELLEMAGVEWL